MTDDSTNCPSCKPMTRALAWAGVVVAAALPALISVLPQEAKPWNVSVVGAVGLFAAARLSFNRAFLFVALAIVAKDAAVYFALGMDPYPLSWVYFLGYVAVGYAFLRRTDSPLAIAGGALGASLLFFVASNFVSWLEQAAPYGYSLAGLADCYAAGVPFFRGTIIGDLFFSGVLFGAHAVLSRVCFPAERVVPVAVTSAEARS